MQKINYGDRRLRILGDRLFKLEGLVARHAKAAKVIPATVNTLDALALLERVIRAGELYIKVERKLESRKRELGIINT